MADQPQIKKGPAEVGSTQLPQGAATQLNQEMAAVPKPGAADAAATAAATPATDTTGGSSPSGQTEPSLSPVTMTPPPAMGPQALPGEDDNLLFGPTSRPMEHPATGGFSPLSVAPDSMDTWYPALHTAASDPETPPKVKELFQLVNMMMGRR